MPPVWRMNSILIQFGVRNVNPVLRKAPEKLESLRTPEGILQPSNAVAAPHRQMERFRVIKEQIKGHRAEIRRFGWQPVPESIVAQGAGD